MEITLVNKVKIYLKRILATVFNLAGGFYLAKRFSSPSVTIIAYHRIIADDYCGVRPYIAITESNLQRHIKFFKKHYTVISLEEAVSRIKLKQIDKNYLVITFDDGYQDNYSIGTKLFVNEKVRPIVFVTTGCVDNQRLLWPDRVRRIVYEAKIERSMQIENPSILVNSDMNSRISAVKQIISFAKLLNIEDRDSYIAGIETVFGLPAMTERTMLSWDEIRNLRDNGVDLGSHTVNHIILTTMSSESVLAEVSVSKERIEAETGLPVKYFAYPNGTCHDFSEPVIFELNNAGYEAAVSTVRGVNRHDCDLFKLRRTGIYLTDTIGVIKAKLAVESLL